MTKLASLLTVGIIGLAALLTLAWAQDAPPRTPPTPDTPQVKPKPDLDAPLPAEQLTAARVQAELGMTMIPIGLAKQFDLTDAQKDSAKQILKDKWTAFGKDNQDKLFRVMILGRQLMQSGQGTPEDFQKLAKEAQPVVESSMKMLNDAATEFTKVLDDNQKAKFAEQMAQFKQRTEPFLTNVKRVADGQIKLEPNGQPAGGWPDEAGMGRGGRGGNDMQVIEEEVDQIGPDGIVHKVKVKRIKSKLPDEDTVAGDEKYWTPLLKGFIAKYDLDDDQQKLARKMLGEALGRASETRKRLKQAFDDAVKKIKDAEAGDDPQAIANAHLAYEHINRPVVTTFKDLQRQLDELVTPQQRESAKNRGELFGAKPQAKDAPIVQPKDAPKDQPKEDPKGTDTKVHVIN